ncbi:uncharacterized protein [Amphiura filiformis]|uniref:uncharacterized protein n=1 Tax=Amphiura filiformis TaxID=82378 RepID=UPI003B211268
MNYRHIMDIIQVFVRFLFVYAATFTITVGQEVECPAAISTSPSSGRITSPGYPENYPINRVCQWTLSVPQGYILVLDFDFIDIETNEPGTQCFDFIEVYDGPIASRDVARLTLCGSRDPDPFTSTGNNLFIRFTSDFSVTRRGFRAVYRTELFQPVPCNATLELEASASGRGIIVSPNFPAKYPDNGLCAWTITAAAGSYVSLQITNIDMEESGGTCYDYLEVYDGLSASSTLIGKYCGVDPPDPVISTGSSLWLLFNADNTIGGVGFRAIYQQTGNAGQPISNPCGGTLTSHEGSIVSPRYPNTYPLNTECVWLIQVPAGNSIRLQFTVFDLEDPDSSLMCSDYLQIRDGADGMAPRSASYCGENLPSRYISSGNALWVHFYSDGNIASAGFAVTYETFIAQPTVCGSIQTISSTSGVITSPQYPSNYPDLADCDWTIQGTQGSYITLMFTDFDVEPANSQGLCSYDELKVTEGALDNDPVLGSLCGSEIPSLVTSSGNTMGLHFTSGNTIVSTGFRAVYSIIQPVATQSPVTTPAQPIQCGGTLSAISGAILSPRYPQNYPINIECTWIIQAQSGFVVSAEFLYFDLEEANSGLCLFDSLEIRDGGSVSSPVLSSSCGSTIPASVTSSGTLLWVRFKSDDMDSRTGFKLTYQQMVEPTDPAPPPCGGTLTNSRGEIRSPSYPGLYPSNSLCAWIIQAPVGSAINLAFLDFNLQDAADSGCVDIVDITDGASLTAPIVGSYCGNALPPSFTSSRNRLWVRFQSDTSISGNGFTAIYTHVVDTDVSCGGQLSGSGTITSPRYPQAYPLSSQCTWVITAPAGQVVMINIAQFAIEGDDGLCQFEYLEVRDGLTQSSPGIGRYCGNTIPSSISSTGNSMWIRFNSDGSYTSTGFTLNYVPQLLATEEPPPDSPPCGGILTQSVGIIQSPRYSSQYPRNVDCRWTIQAPQGYAVVLVFVDFDLEEQTAGVCFDALQIRDGSTRSSPLISEHCGNALPSPISSTGNSMWIQFYSDDSTAGTGFQATFRQIDINECSSNPCRNGATCVNGDNQFRCDCVAGFEGTYCEGNINECVSSPCFNGATCNNGQNQYTCQCTSGFRGERCDTAVLPCESNPCDNGGVCYNGNNGFICVCQEGWTGNTCTQDIDECVTEPCQHGGVCVNGRNQYSCQCLPGFFGSNCQTDENDCVGTPCMNGGVCMDGANHYTCDCMPGFTGQVCDIDVDECGSSPCQNGATCYNGENAYYCQCTPGWQGLTCAQDINECLSSPCQNGGTCMNGRSQFSCECQPGYAGASCQIDTNECLSGPCMNGGMCIDGQNQFTCDCAAGFIGEQCDQEVDECESNPCANGGQCYNGDNAFHCQCRGGWTGPSCLQDINECLSTPCQNGGTCINEQNQFRCECRSGYSGTKCEVDVDECASYPCQNGGSCYNAPGFFVCQCVAGWDGATCNQDIDECSSGPCQNGATCVNGQNQFTCQCIPGYDGVQCESDINECVSGPCQNNGVCINGRNQFTCECPTGYAGSLCQTNVDECVSSPCANGGICVDGSNQYVCQCLEGWEGTMCDQDVNECLSSPCQNRATCINGQNQFTCECVPGFQGTRCEADINECMSSPCQNGGTCINEHNRFRCECTSGYLGARCQTDVDECSSTPCQNGATCVNGQNQFTCQCPSGYAGVFCETAVNECQSNPCENGGRCFDAAGFFICDCVNGWDGTTCSNDINECLSGPCQNGATCTNGRNQFTCTCLPGYQGGQCEINANECSSSPCQNGAPCVDGINQYTCACLPGFTGTTCQTDVNECSSNPCQSGGTCVDEENQYTCNCRTGYSGPRCELNTNECSSSPCRNGAACVDGINQYTCTCLPGFIGTTCETDVNECTSNPCQNGATCVDGENQYTCTCQSGYFGPTCAHDVNECISIPCQNGGTCVNLMNAYRCDCRPGYHGVHCQTDIDECSSGPCQNGATCVNGQNQFTCQCAPGFQGVKCENDINECSSRPCQNGATCRNRQNGFICNCAPGFQGTYCQADINECLSLPCQNGGICQNGLNRFRCDCIAGFAGEFCEEDVNECSSSPCLNGATCISGVNQFSCECSSGFSGNLCQINLDECSSNPCSNGGVCDDGDDEFICTCPVGFYGRRCESDVNECSSSPCQNAGTCYDGVDLYHCVCTDGWQGQNCQQDVNECQSNPCKNGATCNNGRNQYRCDCMPGYQGVNCDTDINECASNPCLNGATCGNDIDGFTCDCRPGYQGIICETDIDECESTPCANGGLCFDGTNTYTCICSDGWTGLNCMTDVDECARNPCLNEATCLDGRNEFTCECAAGYSGRLCEREINECSSSPCANNGGCIDEINGFYCACLNGFTGPTCTIDVDECTSSPCLNEGTCVDGQDRFICNCKPGFQGALCEANIDECRSWPCMNGGSCQNEENQFSCNCIPGFSGTHCQIDIDECSNGPCNNGGTCMDGINQYQCRCVAGWTGPTCLQDINECSSGPCQNGATCVNEQNQFTCQCAPGYQGIQCESDINECASLPCKNGGLCRDEVNQFSCACASGWWGVQCDQEINECASEPCQNNGACVQPQPNIYQCQCMPGWEGLNCERDINECASEPCANGATCHNQQNRFICTCVPGWQGVHCNEVVPSPSPDTCGGILTDPSGQLLSPGFPDSYPSNLNCVWEIQAPNGFVVEMEFVHLDVEKLDDCVDMVKVSESADIETELVGRYCGHLDTSSDPIPLEPITSHGNSLWIQLLTNPTGENTGFRIEYRQIADPTPVFHDCAGETLNVDLPEGESTVPVDWREPTASDHLGNRILVTLVTGPSPPIRQGPGLTEIIYEASTASGSRATCEFAVEIHDKEAPVVLECPDEPIIIKTPDLPVTPDFPSPTFSDNVGIDVIVMEPDLKTLDTFGEYTITYIARDATGNEATCDVTVQVVLKEVCPELEKPPHTRLSCSDDYTVCVLQCTNDFVFPDRVTVGMDGLVLQCIANQWVNMEVNTNITTLPACARVNTNGVKWTRQDTARYQITTDDAQCIDIQDNIPGTLKQELQNSADLMARCNAFENTTCDIDSVIIECNNAERRKRQQSSNAEIAIGTYVLSAERDNATDIQPLEIVLSVPVSMLVPEELVVDGPQGGQIILKLLSASAGETVVVCSQGKEPAGARCVDCPPGTSYSIDDSTCLPCLIGSYQDAEGQMVCKTCSKNYITESDGAFDSSLCSKYIQPTAPSTTATKNITPIAEPFVGSMIFYIVVGAGGGSLLLFIFITICCCTSRKKTRRPEEFIDAYKEDVDNDYADSVAVAKLNTSHDAPFASNVAFYSSTGEYSNPTYKPNKSDNNDIYDTIHENEFTDEEDFEISTL